MTSSASEINLNDSVAQHMRTEVARLVLGQTVAEAIAALRDSPPPARIVYFYVVDGENKLHGVIPSRALLLSPPEARLADLMLRRVVAIPAEATVLDACEFFVMHRFLAFPVVDPQGGLVGAIDLELYAEGVRDLGEAPQHDDLFELVGIHLARARQRGPWDAFRIRFPWLMCNIVGGIVAAFLCGLFEEQIHRAVALAFFVPVVLALAESVSIQSVSLTVQILRSRPPSWRSIVRKLHGELMIGLLLGGAAGTLVGLVALVWLGQMPIAVCILDGIVAGVAVAAILGAAVPSLLHRLRLDPRVAAGPMVLAITDVITLICYFNVAKWLLR